MARPLEYNATLIRRQDLTDLLTIFTIRPDEPPAADLGDGRWFIPGQYLTIGLNREPGIDPEGDDRPPSVRRAMSIASPADEREAIELYIRRVTQPTSKLPLTPMLWRRREGARMYLRPVATGHFTLHHTVGEDDRRLKVMVAAGTGLAPFVCIARSRLRADPKADLSDLVILHGASYPSDLGYREELEAMARTNGLHYVPTISRPHEAPDWRGAVGRAEAHFTQEAIEAFEARVGLPPGGLTPKNAAVLICGLNGTIANCLVRLAARGFVPHHPRLRRVLGILEETPPSVFYEQYDIEPPLDVQDEDLMGRLRADLARAGVALGEPVPR